MNNEPKVILDTILNSFKFKAGFEEDDSTNTMVKMNSVYDDVKDIISSSVIIDKLYDYLEKRMTSNDNTIYDAISTVPLDDDTIVHVQIQNAELYRVKMMIDILLEESSDDEH